MELAYDVVLDSGGAEPFLSFAVEASALLESRLVSSMLNSEIEFARELERLPGLLEDLNGFKKPRPRDPFRYCVSAIPAAATGLASLNDL